MDATFFCVPFLNTMVRIYVRFTAPGMLCDLFHAKRPRPGVEGWMIVGAQGMPVCRNTHFIHAMITNMDSHHRE